MLFTAFVFYATAASQLLFFAFSWLKIMTLNQIRIGITIGIPVGILKYFLVFNKPNKKNKSRILSGELKQKIYSVFRPTAFFLVLAMISLGLSLRLVFNVPRHIIMPIYLAIGIGLLISSFYYLLNYLLNYLKVKNSY